jgi:hypothetical protein
MKGRISRALGRLRKGAQLVRSAISRSNIPRDKEYLVVVPFKGNSSSKPARILQIESHLASVNVRHFYAREPGLSRTPIVAPPLIFLAV